MISRRDVLTAGGAGLLATACARPAAATTNDISQLEATPLAAVVAIGQQADIVAALSRHRGQVCVAGARYSMGGQTSAAHALQLDMDR